MTAEVIKVKSIFIESVQHRNGNLIVRMRNGRGYSYKDVTPNKVTRFLNAESKGSYFSKYIKGQYEMRRLPIRNKQSINN